MAAKDDFWKLFESSGCISHYLLYKKVKGNGHNDKGDNTH